MRKAAAMVFATAIILSACSSDTSNSAASPTPESTVDADDVDDSASSADTESGDIGASDSSEEIEVDKGLLDVEILLPADFVAFLSGGESPEVALTEISEDGFDDAEINADGSILLKMSRLRYEGLMDELRDGLDEYLAELPSPQSGITRAEANRDFTEFTITVDRASASPEALGSLGFLSFGLAITAGIYQIFDGVGADETQLRVDFVDAATGEVFDSYDSATQ